MGYPVGVSFIIPAYNEEKNIQDCIYTIQLECLRQSPTIMSEIIVVDNGSTDATSAKAEASGATVIVEETKGVVHARDAGYRHAHYALLANIDADNRVPPGWLKIALDSMIDPKVVAVSGPLSYVEVPRYVNTGARVFYFFARIFHHLLGPTIQGGNYIIRKDVLDKMHGYDKTFTFYGEDTATARSAACFGIVKLNKKMWINASPRRLREQGIINTIIAYTINYIWVSLFGRSLTQDYKDYR